MAKIKLVFYKEADGTVPVLDWILELPRKVQAKCYLKLERLAELGHELRRPEADLLRDKIYELRIGFQGIHYRILYFFHGSRIAVVAHGIVKERIVPPSEIEKAVQRRIEFEMNPAKHTAEDEA